MRIELKIADDKRCYEVLHAFRIIHDEFTHDEDWLTFYSKDERFKLVFGGPCGEIFFGPADAPYPKDRSQIGDWFTNNTDVGTKFTALANFFLKEYEQLGEMLRKHFDGDDLEAS